MKLGHGMWEIVSCLPHQSQGPPEAGGLASSYPSVSPET